MNDPVLRAKLAKGMGHNYYGEPAWPNDLLYIFPVVILGTIVCDIGLAVLEPSMIGYCNSFGNIAWMVFLTVPNKLLGVLLMVSVTAWLLTVHFSGQFNKF